MNVLKFMGTLIITIVAPYIVGASYPTMKYTTAFEKWFIGTLILGACGFIVFIAIIASGLLD